MADLFSKEYLKDLLASGGLDEALKTTAKAGLETATKKIADGEESGLPFADRILNSGDGFTRDVATEALDQAAKALSDGPAEDVTEENAEGEPATEDPSSGRSLFSGNYLQNLLESDRMNELIDERIGDNELLENMVDAGKERISTRYAPANDSNASHVEHGYVMEPGILEQEFVGPDGTVYTISEDPLVGASNAGESAGAGGQVPPPVGFPQSVSAPSEQNAVSQQPSAGQVNSGNQPAPPPAQGARSDDADNKGFSSRRKGGIVGLIIIALLIFGIPSCGSCAASSNQTTYSGYKSYVSYSKPGISG